MDATACDGISKKKNSKKNKYQTTTHPAYFLGMFICKLTTLE
jgi:hypothetical protein